MSHIFYRTPTKLQATLDEVIRRTPHTVKEVTIHMLVAGMVLTVEDNYERALIAAHFAKVTEGTAALAITPENRDRAGQDLEITPSEALHMLKTSEKYAEHLTVKFPDDFVAFAALGYSMEITGIGAAEQEDPDPSHDNCATCTDTGCVVHPSRQGQK